VDEMNAWTPLAWGLLGISVVAMLGVVAVTIRKAFAAHRSLSPRPHSVSCLICGHPNKVSSKEWEKSRVTCACGQMLYLAPPALERIIP
jgi:hypothetical protein